MPIKFTRPSKTIEAAFEAQWIVARAGKPSADELCAAGVGAPRTLPLPVEVQVTPGRVVHELEMLGKMTEEDRRRLQAACDAHVVPGTSLASILELDHYPGTDEMAALSDVLRDLDLSTPGLHSARNALNFWLRSELPGGGLIGLLNAFDWDDYK